MRSNGYCGLRPSPAKILLIVSCLVAMGGCVRDFGTGGTGETVVPRRELREIRPLDLDAMSGPVSPTTVPSTRPAGVRLGTTQPDTRPDAAPATAPAEVSLTLADV